jgi:hypothetical protein
VKRPGRFLISMPGMIIGKNEDGTMSRIGSFPACSERLLPGIAAVAAGTYDNSLVLHGLAVGPLGIL